MAPVAIDGLAGIALGISLYRGLYRWTYRDGVGAITRLMQAIAAESETSIAGPPRIEAAL